MPKISYLDHISTLLPAEEIEAFQSCYQQRLPKTIKIITSKISPAAFQKNVEAMGWKLEKTIHSDIFYVHTFTDSASLGQHFLHQGGFFYIQELSASMSAPLLDAQPGDLILDMCAAPGGKTVQLADTGAFVVANEPLNPRRKALIYNINRCGLSNTAVTNIDGTRFGKEYPELFDKILVDAPCSGEGMSYKTGGPLSRNEGLIKSLARTQVQLLESAIHACKVGGIIVYSTCTLNEIENEEVLAKMQEKYGSVIEPLIHKKYRPHRDKCGGFFLAKFLKKSHVQTTKTSSLSQKIPSFDLGTKLQAQAKSYLIESFGIEKIPEDILFYATSNAIYLTTKYYAEIHGKVSIDKVGIPLWDIARDGTWIPLHTLGNIFGKNASQNVFQMDLPEIQSYAAKKDIPIVENNQEETSKFVIIQRKSYGFSLAKRVGNMLKNKIL